MAKENAGASDKVECALGVPDDNDNNAFMRGAFDMVCWETGPDGQPRQVWSQRAKNGVVRGGLAMLGNVGLAGQRATTGGPFMFLHSAGYNYSYKWGDISGSHVGGYGASIPPIALSSGDTSAIQWTATTAYTFSNAGTFTVAGAGLVYYSSASVATAPAASADLKLYNIGTFSAAQNVQSNNTLSVTISLNVSSA